VEPKFVDFVSTEVGLDSSAAVSSGVILGIGLVDMGIWGILCRGRVMGSILKDVRDSVELGEMSPFPKIEFRRLNLDVEVGELNKRLTPGRWMTILTNKTMIAMEKRQP